MRGRDVCTCVYVHLLWTNIISCNQTLHGSLIQNFQNEQKTKFYSLILMIKLKKQKIYTKVHSHMYCDFIDIH